MSIRPRNETSYRYVPKGGSDRGWDRKGKYRVKLQRSVLWVGMGVVYGKVEM